MNTRKNGLLDRRFNCNKEEVIKRKKLAHRLFIQQLVGFAVLGFIAGTILTVTIYRETHKPLVQPIAKPMSFEVVKVAYAKEKDWEDDLVGYFRYRGQQLGYNDYQITKLHGVMDCENGLHTAKRVNYLYDGENGRYTAAGFGMITKSTFNDKQFKCMGDRFDGTDNIDCVYKIYAKKGLARWNASKHCWSKKFDFDGLKLK